MKKKRRGVFSTVPRATVCCDSDCNGRVVLSPMDMMAYANGTRRFYCHRHAAIRAKLARRHRTICCWRALVSNDIEKAKFRTMAHEILMTYPGEESDT